MFATKEERQKKTSNSGMRELLPQEKFKEPRLVDQYLARGKVKSLQRFQLATSTLKIINQHQCKEPQLED